jgi:hypothetical protein
MRMEDINIVEMQKKAELILDEITATEKGINETDEARRINEKKKVLESAEKVTGRRITEWFVSASIGYYPKENARAWLTYNLKFQGED